MTQYEQKYYAHDIPTAVRALESIAKSLKVLANHIDKDDLGDMLDKFRQATKGSNEKIARSSDGYGPLKMD